MQVATAPAAAAGRADLALRLYRMMVRVRFFEEFCIDLRKRNEVVANTYPSLGQEASVAVAAALGPDDVVFPSYRSRPAFFGRGVTAEDHFVEMLATPDSTLHGREVFHHASFPAKGVMPGSSMIGSWLPMAAGYALTQKMEGGKGITACHMGDGTFGAGDLHETLNLAGIWKLPFMLVCENNGYQVSQHWSKMRVQREMRAYFEPHGFTCLEVDGNDALAVFDAALHGRGIAAGGTPVLLDCFTYRMGSYSSHFPEPRKGIEQEKADWLAKDPLARGRDACAGLGLSLQQLDQAVGEERAQIAAAWERAQARARSQPESKTS